MGSRLFLTNAQVLNSVHSLGNVITEYYKGRVSEENPLFVVVVAQGAIKFYAELCNTLRVPNVLGLINTHGEWTDATSRTISLIDFKAEALSGKHVLVVEDICDSGNTLNLIKETLQHESTAASIRVAVLFKNDKSPVKAFEPDYFCFETGGRYVYGFGLDSHDGLDRNQSSVYFIEEEAPDATDVEI